LENDAQDYGKCPSLTEGCPQTNPPPNMRHEGKYILIMRKKYVFILMMSVMAVLFCALAQAAEAPFAANLFQGNFAKSQRSETLALEPGDRVVLRLWGELNFDGTLIVDDEGDISLPENSGKPVLGRIPVAGLTHDKLGEALKSKLAAAGLAHTQVYVAPLDTRPVAVFVTGGVKNPGRYAGSPSDSVLAFLDRAGGIDSVRGSYRSIRLLRGAETVAMVDLYPFAQKGLLPQLRLHDGDTLVVDERGITVEASGEVRTAARFEFLPDGATGTTLMALAEPGRRASHATVNGMRKGRPYTTYLPLKAFRELRLEDGDRVQFSADTTSDTIMVEAQGAVRGTPRFPVRRGASLNEVRNYIAVEPSRANLSAVYIKRKSVVLRQKKAIADALHRLEQTAFTATAASAEEAQIRAKEAEMLSKFVERAKTVEPEGIVVVDNADLSLEDGDIIVVPEKSDVVMVSGEVQIPQALVWNKKKSFGDYIKDAGGYTGRADRDTSLIMRQNGAVVRSGDVDVMPGDQILVLPKVESKIMQAVKDVALVLYQVAVSSRVVLGL